MWFRIPEYQRPYVWTKDEVTELLDDLTFASKDKPYQEYFLGSLVYQSRKAVEEKGEKFDENDLLDGQQRMTTLFLLFACIRDLSGNENAKRSCHKAIFQEGNEFSNVPERTRIVFAIRQSVQDFVDEFVKAEGGTNRTGELESLQEHSKDTSIKNMAAAVLVIREFFQTPEKEISPEALLKFLLNRVLLIYVATQSFDDAFRLFTILNARGVPLRNSDILKSLNLGPLKPDEKTKYAKLWEDAESALGDDFDRFLNYLRTILVKEKARLSLLQEFEDKIYDPKEKDKSTGLKRLPLLEKGKATFKLVERYLKNYNVVLRGGNYSQTGGSFQFDNLVKVMLTGLPSTDWVPPLLLYFDRFGHDRIFEFLTHLDNKFSADWIAQYTPTDRIEKMNSVIKVIEQVGAPDAVLSDACLAIDAVSFMRAIEGDIYGRRFARYLLLKLDYFYANHSSSMALDALSVEHILPQNPEDSSQWKRDFDDAQRANWTDKVGNLVLITRSKNASQGRLDYGAKKTKYFLKSIDTCPNSLRVLNGNGMWTLSELEANHRAVLKELRSHYRISATATTA